MRRICFVLAFLLLSLHPLWAETEEEEDLPVILYEDALERVHREGTDFQIAEINKRISQRDGSVASSWIPSLAVSSSLVNGSGGYNPEKTDWNWKYATIGVKASLSIGASNFTNIISSIVNSKLAQFTYDQTVKGLDQALFSLYWGVSGCAMAVESSRMSCDLAAKVVSDTEAKYNAGLVSSLDMMNAKLALSNAQKAYIDLSKTYNDTYLTLKAMLKADDDFSVEILNDPVFVDFPSSDVVYNKYLTTNATIKQLDLAYQATKAGYDTAAWGSRLPTFSFSFSYNYGKDLASMGAMKMDDNMSFAIAAALPLDGFIPGTSIYTTIADLKDRTKIAELNRAEGYNTYREKIEISLCEIKSYETAFRTSAEQVEFAAENYKLSQEAYENGKIPMSTFSSALNSLLSAQISYISANVGYQCAVQSFASYLGVPYEDFMNEYKIEKEEEGDK